MLNSFRSLEILAIAMDRVSLDVVDLSLLLEKVAIKGAPPYNVQRLGVAVLSAKFMKDFDIRLGQPIRLVQVSSPVTLVPSVKEEDSLSLAFKQSCSVIDSSDMSASSAAYREPSFLLLLAWPLSFLPYSVIALDTWSCCLLFMDAWRRQVIHDTTLEVALKVKKEMDGKKASFPSTPVSGKKKHKSPKNVQLDVEETVTVCVRITNLYSEEEHCKVCGTVVLRIVGFGPPSVDGKLEPVELDRLEQWYDDIYFESYVTSIVSKRYLVPGCWFCISKDGRDLYFVCHRIVSSIEEEEEEEDGHWNEDRNKQEKEESGTIWKVGVHTKMEWLRVGTGNKYTEPVLLGGLDEQMAKMKSFLSNCCFNQEYREQLSRLGIRPSRGIVLHGPPGTGKSTLAQVVASSMRVHCVRIVRAPSIISGTFGETESTLMEIFQQVGSRVPSILVIDDIDALGVSRDSKLATEAELRLTGALLSCIDGMPNRMVLIGTTHRLDSLDAALRRPGRLDMELEVPVPNSRQRFSILYQLARSCISSKQGTLEMQVDLTDDDLEELSNDLHGYVGADIVALWRESCYLAYTRWKQEKGSSCVVVCLEDLRRARKEIFPSAMREITVEVAQVRWDDIGGYERVKRELREAVEWPKKYSHYFRRFGITPMKGILLYGPPGCSKTLMAKALANETSCHFLSVKGPELFQKWVGESEKAVRNLFRKAKSVAPCIIFFDEIDALACRRQDEQGVGSSSHAEQRVLAQLLTEMDGISSNHGMMGGGGWTSNTSDDEESWIFVLGATNRPDLLDPALIRPGRFDRLVYVGLPDSEARESILRIHCRCIPLKDSSMDWKSLVASTQGMTGAELASLCREATLNALKQVMDNCCDSQLEHPQVEYSHFEMALRQVKPRTNRNLLLFYEQFAKHSGHHHL